jgi:hypothetical protein
MERSYKRKIFGLFGVTISLLNITYERSRIMIRYTVLRELTCGLINLKLLADPKICEEKRKVLEACCKYLEENQIKIWSKDVTELTNLKKSGILRKDKRKY